MMQRFRFCTAALVLAAAGLVFAEDQPVDKAAEAGYAAKAAQQRAAADARANGTNQAARDREDKKKNLEEYKDKLKSNLELIKDMFQKAEDAWKNQHYKDAGMYYQSVALATVPGAEDMAETSRGRLIEMEDLAREHLKAAEDADLSHEPLKEVEELTAVVKDFGITSQKEAGMRRLINLRSRPDVAAYVDYAQAEALETDGKLAEAVAKYQEISTAPRYEHTVPALKASRKLAELQKDETVREKLKADLQARADKEAPGLLNSAKNFVTNNMPKKAIEKLQQVIDKYPGTAYADDAQKMLGELK